MDSPIIIERLDYLFNLRLLFIGKRDSAELRIRKVLSISKIFNAAAYSNAAINNSTMNINAHCVYGGT
jgi:hypothetical protein